MLNLYKSAYFEAIGSQHLNWLPCSEKDRIQAEFLASINLTFEFVHFSNLNNKGMIL